MKDAFRLKNALGLVDEVIEEDRLKSATEIISYFETSIYTLREIKAEVVDTKTKKSKITDCLVVLFCDYSVLITPTFAFAGVALDLEIQEDLQTFLLIADNGHNQQLVKVLNKLQLQAGIENE